MSLAICRQHVANIEQRKLQDVAKVLFVFLPRQSTQRAATVRDDVGAIGFCDQVVQCLHRGLTIKVWEIRCIGRHLARLDAIVNQNPAVAQLVVAERECQRSEIESACRRWAVVTVEAGLPDQFSKRLGKLGSG